MCEKESAAVHTRARAGVIGRSACRRVEVECSVSARCLNVDKPRRAANSRLIRLRLRTDGLDVRWPEHVLSSSAPSELLARSLCAAVLCSYRLVLRARRT